jgi:hypothetical protein
MYLSSVSHYQSCNITNDLKHGESGTGNMMQVSILFAYTLFPQCLTMELSDESGFADSKTGRATRLADRDMFLHKKTWYQRMLPMMNLKPKGSKGRTKIAKFIETLNIKPTAKACSLIGISQSSRTLFEGITNIKKENDPYSSVVKAMYHYDMPSMLSMPWYAKLSLATFVQINLEFKEIKKPKDLKAQWGGSPFQKDQYYRYITWIE